MNVGGTGSRFLGSDVVVDRFAVVLFLFYCFEILAPPPGAIDNMAIKHEYETVPFCFVSFVLLVMIGPATTGAGSSRHETGSTIATASAAGAD